MAAGAVFLASDESTFIDHHRQCSPVIQVDFGELAVIIIDHFDKTKRFCTIHIQIFRYNMMCSKQIY